MKRIPEYVEVLSEEQGCTLIKPSYRKASICEIAGTILKHFNVESDFKPLSEEVFNYGVLDRAEKVVLIVSDSLGYIFSLNFRGVYKRAKFSTVLTSTAPSTTSTAIASMFYGLTPLEHGVLGYHMYLERLGTIVNILKFTPILNPSRDSLLEYGVSHEDLIPHETLFQVLVKNGVKVVKILPENLVESSYTNLTSKGAEKEGYVTLADMFVKILKEVNDPETPKLIVVYWWGLDTVQHVYGTRSQEALTEFNTYVYLLNELVLSKINSTKCRVILTSDHGQVDVSSTIHLDQIKEVVDNLIVPPAGESRFFMMFPRDKEAMIKFFKEEFNEEVIVFSKDEVIEHKILGFDGSGEFTKRVGDVLVACKKDVAFTYKLKKEPDVKVEKLKALHGSLTVEEMLVPLIVF